MCDLSFVPKSLGNPQIHTSASHILSLRQPTGFTLHPLPVPSAVAPVGHSLGTSPGLLIETALAPAT